MNNKLILVLILVSVGIRSEVTYYKQIGDLRNPNWINITSEEFNKQQEGMVYGGCQMPYSPNINGMKCSSCDFVYATCVSGTPKPAQQQPIVD